ncbi:hypothetical protein JQX13_50135 [Archangium violaceum]|uniref:hypothetical protein n=1 Tax=Archangium violaceum TaxID=83451 RepID=UPI00193B3D14|nr:hypothetical protein [Archangium violaceum]QRK08034.1 hypothetical protein JQX13_50135 [Archangium violaceum]
MRSSSDGWGSAQPHHHLARGPAGGDVIFHLKPMPAPYYVAPTMAAALDWVLAQLEAAGLTEEAARIRRSSERLAYGRTG